MRLGLKGKLVSLCLVISLVSCVIGIISYVGTSRLSKSYESVTDVSLPNLKNLNHMFLIFRDIRINLRTLGLPDLSETESKTYIANVTRLIGEFEEANKKYHEVKFIPGEEELYQNLQKEWEFFKGVGGKLLSAYALKTPQGREMVKNIILIDCPDSAARFTKAIDALKEFQDKKSADYVVTAKDMADDMNIVIISLIVVGLIGSLTIGVLFSNNITSRISAIANELMSSSEEASVTSDDLSNSSTRLSESSSESAASLEETVASVEELSSMVKLNSDHAKEANALSQRSLASAESGKEEITKLMTAMTEMSKSSKKIEEIINVIDDIAFQTNLLALNAAVEAARAGDQGKGFAVVADAVRNLAQRSAAAAKDIHHLIQDNVQKTGQGTAIANTSGTALFEIVTAVKKVADLNLEISAASQEQSNGIHQISSAMNHLDSATQSNAAASQEVSTSAGQMLIQSQALVNLANDLKLFISGEDQERAVGF